MLRYLQKQGAFCAFILSFLGLQPIGLAQEFESGYDHDYQAGRSHFFSRSVFQVQAQNGQPLLAARILIGMDVSVPFDQNLLITDGRGEFVAPEQWVDSQPVTIEAPGFVRVTYFDVSPDQPQTFVLRPLVAPSVAFELSGLATGFQVKNRDGQVDFGLTVPVVKPEELFQFNLNMILSPYSDSISIIGRQVEVPSNVTLPKQRESYILPITLEKPQYRMGFVESGTKHLVSLSGTFPVKPVFDAFRAGSSFADVINSFNMQGVSIHEVDVTQKKQRLDIRMNQHVMSQFARLKAPVFNGNSEVVLGVSIATHPMGLFPVDVKRLTSNTLHTLKTFGTEARALSILRSKEEFDGKIHSERLSASLEIWNQDGQELLFLPLMKNPTMGHSHNLNLNLVAVPGGYYESGALYRLSTIKQVKDKSGEVKSESKGVFWEAYSPRWASQVEFPRFPGVTLPAGPKRWSASLFAAKSSMFRVQSMKNLVKGEISHVTHANVDFQ